MGNTPARVDQRQQGGYNNNAPVRQPPRKIDTLRQDQPRTIRQVPTEEVLYELMAENNWLNLSADQRLAGYTARCEAIGLDPMTFPFEFIEFTTGKVTLYPTRAATDQLRRLYGVSCKITDEGFDRDTKTLWAKAEATFPDGRTDEDVAYLWVGDKGGLELANQKMKVITKAKRRVTLSAIGLGQMAEKGDDYDEGRYIRKVDVDLNTGALAAGEAAPDANDYRRLHGVIAKRLPGHDAHWSLRCLAAALFSQTGSLKLIGPSRITELHAYLADAESEDIAEDIDRGAEILADLGIYAPESRQTNATAPNASESAQQPNDASVATVDDDDAEFNEVDPYDTAVGEGLAGIVEGIDAIEVDEDGVITEPGQTGDELDRHENAVYNWIAAIEETNTKRQLDKVAADIEAAGIVDSRITTALESKYDQAAKVTGKARPVFGQDLPVGEPGANRHTD